MKPTRLDELRSILLGPDHEKLEALDRRVTQPAQRSEDVSEVLPESIATSFKRDSRLVQALRTPLRQCVSESVREDPDEYADALFPVMGPAIRRAVAEAFKGWIQQANQAMEQSLSARGLAWRVQAWRAGIPFGQYVLQRTLLYRVEHVYLIQSGSGLLIEHVHQADVLAKDEDAVSAMFTAIQDFVQDSFQRAGSELRTAELGELTLWAVHGPSSTIVAVIRGLPPTGLRAELAAAQEDIEARYSRELRGYAGERGSLSQVRPRLEQCLLVSMREPDAPAQPRRVGPLGVLLAVIALLLLAWLGYELWMQNRVQRLGAALASTPGIVVTALDRDGGGVILRGLRDPLAARIQDIATQAGWTGPIAAELRPFLSLEPDLVLQRAQAVLAPPVGVDLALDGETLVINGQAPAQWIAAARATNPLPGVRTVDLSGVRPITERSTARQPAQPAAPEPTPAPQTDDPASVQQQMAEIAARLAAMSFGFDQGAALARLSTEQLNTIVSGFNEYAALAGTLGLTATLSVVGNTDDSGPDSFNRQLELRRAEQVKTQLVNRGVDADAVTALSQLQSGAPGSRAREVRVMLATRDTVMREN